MALAYVRHELAVHAQNRQHVDLVGAQERVALGHRLVRGRVDALAKADGRIQGDGALRSRRHLREVAEEMARLVGIDENVLQHFSRLTVRCRPFASRPACDLTLKSVLE